MPLAERLLAALMIGSQLLAWLALTFIGAKTVVYTAAFYWCWALKNILLGPLTTDLGVITFGLVMAAEVLSPWPVLTGAASLLVGVQFGVVALRCCLSPASQVHVPAI
ncbi:MAG: hypothetical protein SGPRY_012750, partial [Prymnesium sp.]